MILGPGRKKPMFPIEFWNAYGRTIMNLPRSNNSIEGWHDAFAKRVAIVHPSVTKLAEKMHREQSKFEMDTAQSPAVGEFLIGWKSGHFNGKNDS